MPKKLTLSDFISKAKKVHGETYIYSNVEYINAHTKIDIKCRVHGLFSQKPNNHLSGLGCVKCGVEKRSKSKSMGIDVFIKKSKDRFGGKFDYSKSVYVNAKIPLIITCKKHGDFEQDPYVHLNSVSGCPECAMDLDVKYKDSLRETALDIKFKNVIQPIDHKIIPLGNGVFCKVSNEDFDKVKDINWHINGSGYADTRWLSRRGKDHLMHRFIIGVKKGDVIDHKNGDILDNRRDNLRKCTMSENSCNARKRKVATSVYKGVYWDSRSSKWGCVIAKSKKSYYVGMFNKEEDAAIAYNEMAKKLHKEFARLNIIKK